MSYSTIATILGTAALGLLKNKGSKTRLAVRETVWLLKEFALSEKSLEYVGNDIKKFNLSVSDQIFEDKLENLRIEISVEDWDTVEKKLWMHAPFYMTFKPGIFNDWRFNVDTRLELLVYLEKIETKLIDELKKIISENYGNNLIEIAPDSMYMWERMPEDFSGRWLDNENINVHNPMFGRAYGMYGSELLNLDSGEKYEHPKASETKLRKR